MARDSHKQGRYRFEGFELDAASFELRASDGSLVSLPKLAFELLLHLIEQRDRVVSKEELFDQLWADSIPHDNSLSQAVWAVRRALGDTGGAQRVIKSVRGRGYRFIADVEPLRPSAPPMSLANPKPAVADATTTSLIGREAELERLDAALQDVFAGRGRIGLISGGPGIGKTHLAAEIGRRAQVQGARLYQGRCFEDESMPPFWPVQQVVRALVREHVAEPLSELVGDGAVELVKLIPELREGIPDLAAAPERDPSQERFQLFDALRMLFARAACAGPMIVLLDDLQWADESTLLCLEFLAPDIGRMPLLLLVTHRNGPPRPALTHALSTLARQSDCVSVALHGLAESQTETLLARHCADALGTEFVRRVHGVTAGNPFMVIQMARWLATLPAGSRVAAESPLALPPEARLLLEQQLATLPEPTQQLLKLGATFGQEFHLGDLRRASGQPAHTVLEQLDPALGAELLRERDAGHYAFTHPTIRAAIHEALPRQQRAELHRRAAAAIAQANSDDPSSRLDELAHHYYEAASSGGAERAVHYCMLAAQRASEATAFEEAVTLYRRALAALELVDPVDEQTRCRALLGLGRSLRGTPASIESIRGVFLEAAARARAIGDTSLLCEAAMCNAGRGPRRLWNLREAGTVDLTEISLLEQALSSLGPEDSADRALTEAWLADALYHTDRVEQRRYLAFHAVEVARRVADLTVLAECLMRAQATVRGPGELKARCEALFEIAALARELGLRGLQLDAHDERAWALFEAGDPDGAKIEVQAVVRLAEELRLPREKYAVAALRVMQLDGEGRFDEAREFFDQARAAGPRKGDGERLDQGRAIRDFMVMMLRGRIDEVLPALAAYAEKFPLPVGWHCGLCSAYAVAGRHDEARRELTRLSTGQFACIPDDHNWLGSHVSLATACHIVGEADHAAALYERLAAFADCTVLFGLHGFCAGPVERSLAELSLAVGDLDRAEAHAKRAIDRATKAELPMWVAWSRLVYAETLGRRGARGDHAHALEELAHAVGFARKHGLGYLVAWGERLAAGPVAKLARAYV